MDNASLWYRAQYKLALDLAKQGKRLEALQVCWDLRNDPNISLYRRAWVNLLIAANADVRNHPDKSKFAEEAISLAAQIRRNTAIDEETETQLRRIEADARLRLTIIEEEKFVYAAMKGTKTHEEALRARDGAIASLKEMKTRGSSATVGAIDISPDNGGARISTDDIPNRASGDRGTLDPWAIEGTFSDLGKGQPQMNTGVAIKLDKAHGELDKKRAEREMSAASEISLPIHNKPATDQGLSTPPPTSPVRSPFARSPTTSPTKHNTMSLRVGKGGQKRSALSIDWSQPRHMTYSEALKKNLGNSKEQDR